MKAYIQNINEITESREMMEARPNAFVIIFVYLLIAILACALIWSYFGEIDDYSKANGVVRPNDKISTITNKVLGKVENIYFEEGKKVKKGDILYVIEHSTLDIQKSALQNELNKAVKELDNETKLKRSIQDSQNYFDEKNNDERPYYNRYVQYETDMAVQSKQVDQNTESLDKTNSNLKNQELLKQSIEQNKNLFSENEKVYYNQYVDYTLNVKRRQDTVSQKKVAYDSAKELYENNAISKHDFDTAQNDYYAAQLDVETYKNQCLLDLNTKIEELLKSQKEYELSIKNVGQNSGNKQQYTEATLEKNRMDTLVQIDTEIETNQKNIDSINKNLDTLNINIADCTVKSPIDGTVNVTTDINKQDLLQAGTEVLTIIPDYSFQYKVELLASNKDIANIKEGQKIKYHFQALPYKEYGEMEGVITKIGMDSKTNSQTGESYYTVEASIKNKPLYSYKGVKGEIKVGMACEAQIITRSKKILYYILEKINLRD
ncbi:MAG TPA: HlyD family efflux transporter periplasmic adaptor subunit [Clostridia bacterium]